MVSPQEGAAPPGKVASQQRRWMIRNAVGRHHSLVFTSTGAESSAGGSIKMYIFSVERRPGWAVEGCTRAKRRRG